MSRWAPGERSRKANAVQAWLFTFLGGCCDECGAQAPLEIDHPWGREWSPRKVNRLDRWYRYKREALAGEVRLLCSDCNKTLRPQPHLRPKAEQPF